MSLSLIPLSSSLGCFCTLLPCVGSGFHFHPSVLIEYKGHPNRVGLDNGSSFLPIKISIRIFVKRHMKWELGTESCIIVLVLKDDKSCGFILNSRSSSCGFDMRPNDM